MNQFNAILSAECSPDGLKEILERLCWNGIANATWVGEGRLSRSLDESRIDNADHLPGVGIVKRTAAVSGISCAVELQYRIRGRREAFDCARLQLARVTRG